MPSMSLSVALDASRAPVDQTPIESFNVVDESGDRLVDESGNAATDQ